MIYLVANGIKQASQALRHMDGEFKPVKGTQGRWVSGAGVFVQFVESEYLISRLRRIDAKGAVVTIAEGVELTPAEEQFLHKLGERGATVGKMLPPVKTDRTLVFIYKNWRGQTDVRMVTRPGPIFWGSNEFHTEEQWLFTAYDLEKKADRTFALRDCQFHGEALRVISEE